MSVIKGIVLTAILLAVGNFGLQIYLRQDATQNVIISAYREHAIAACRQNGGQNINQAAWSQPSDVRLSIGKGDLDVYLWQTKHLLWNARYRNAYIYVTIDHATSHIYCEYDITNDMAWVYQLGRDAPHQPYQRQG
ncbi:MAG: hypothetical protein ACR2PA_04040 [Hyphomicrobiaceae bacterium]